MMFKNKLNRYSRASLLVLVTLLIQGCFHSEDTPVPDADPTGYYTGSVSVRAANNTDLLEISDAQILINGTRMMIVSDTQAILYDGELVITGNDFTSTATIYQNGSNVGYTASVEGYINEGAEITGTFTGVQLGNGTFESTYSVLNSELASQDIIGVIGWQSWDTDWNFGLGSYSFELDGNGNLQDGGNDSSAASIFISCSMNGTILKIDGTHLYEVKVSITGCVNPSLVSGEFTGLAATKSSDTRLVFSISDAEKEYAFGDAIVKP